MNKVEEYIKKKGWKYKDEGNELRVEICYSCGKEEYHFYINKDEGLFHCKYCDVRGSFFFLQKENGDIKISNKTQRIDELKEIPKSNDNEGFEYLINKRCISQNTIDNFSVISGKDKIGFVYKTPEGKPYNVKVRTLSEKRFSYLKKGKLHYPFGIEKLDKNIPYIIIVEGEIDALSWYEYGFKNILAIAGANNFKGSWIEHFKGFKTAYISLDTDEAGEHASENIINKLKDHIVVKKITLPFKDANECLTSGVDNDAMQRYFNTANEIKNNIITSISEIPIRKATKEDFGITTGMTSLDKLTKWRKGELTIVTAETKVGKSIFTTQLALNQALMGNAVLIGSFELTKEHIMRFLVSMMMNKSFYDCSEQELTKARIMLQDLPIYFIDHYGYIEMEKLKSCILYANKYLDCNFILLDHLQYMIKTSSENTVHAMGEAMRELKKINLETNTHIWLVSHSRRLGQGEKVGFNSLRGSSEIAQICDNTFALERYEDELIKGVKVKLDIARNPLANTGEFTLDYDKSSMRFRDSLPLPEEFKQERGFQF